MKLFFCLTSLMFLTLACNSASFTGSKGRSGGGETPPPVICGDDVDCEPGENEEPNPNDPGNEDPKNPGTEDPKNPDTEDPTPDCEEDGDCKPTCEVDENGDFIEEDCETPCEDDDSCDIDDPSQNDDPSQSEDE